VWCVVTGRPKAEVPRVCVTVFRWLRHSVPPQTTVSRACPLSSEALTCLTGRPFQPQDQFFFFTSSTTRIRISTHTHTHLHTTHHSHTPFPALDRRDFRFDSGPVPCLATVVSTFQHLLPSPRLSLLTPAPPSTQTTNQNPPRKCRRSAEYNRRRPAGRLWLQFPIRGV